MHFLAAGQTKSKPEVLLEFYFTDCIFNPKELYNPTQDVGEEALTQTIAGVVFLFLMFNF